MTAESKIVDRAELARRCEAMRAAGRRVVFTNGCFDLLHVGHLRYLEAARREGDALIVAINGDASVERLKGAGRPVLAAAQRMRVLAGLACVDYVTEFEEDTPRAILAELRPGVLIKGANYSICEVVGREIVEGYGGDVRTVELSEGLSTSYLIERAIAAKQD